MYPIGCRVMADYTVKRIDDIEAIYWGAFKRARADLGLESFGVQVMDLPPNADGYPEHDHADDGHEERDACVRGSADMDIEVDTHSMDRETLISVKSGTKRKVRPGAEGVRLLIVG